MFLEFIILCSILCGLFYYWATKNYDYFEKQGIPYDKPYPLLGSLKDVAQRKKSFLDGVIDLYNKHNGKIYGIFDQRVPLLLIRDPEIIKQITIKDFDHFMNHRTIFNDVDEGNLFGNSLFSMQDAKWKDMRSTLSPIFTGSKMRQTFDLMNKVAFESCEILKKESIDQHELELDVKDFCTRFTNDIIASTAFGLQVNSFEDRENEFYCMGKKVTQFTNWQNMKFFLFAHLKPVMKLLKIELFDKNSTAYFMNLVLDAMKYRQQHNIHRPDMINMLMEARGMLPTDNLKSHNREWTDIEIVAQCFLFFFAGFESSSVLMCFAAHELMENPEMQQKLYEEIEQVNLNLDEGKVLTYEALQGMKYMDMVISETLRKWPAGIVSDRVCNKDFSYEASDGEKINIKKGQAIWMPIIGLHRDPKYFENPMKFDPERFSEENKDQILPFTYMPFGMGPRNCIASRFALLEAKAILFYLVQNFRLEIASQTTIPLKLSPASFQLTAINGFWIKFVPRNSKV